MSPIVYRMNDLLSRVVQWVPVGTNLGLFPLLWMLLSGRLLLSRGAVIPGLAAEAVRRRASTPSLPGHTALYWAALQAPELIGILLPEFPTPLADRFVGDDDAADKEQFFHVAVAEREAEVGCLLEQ